MLLNSDLQSWKQMFIFYDFFCSAAVLRQTSDFVYEFVSCYLICLLLNNMHVHVLLFIYTV